MPINRQPLQNIIHQRGTDRARIRPATRWSVAELAAYLNEANLLTADTPPDTKRGRAHVLRYRWRTSDHTGNSNRPLWMWTAITSRHSQRSPRVAKEQLDSLNLKWQSMTSGCDSQALHLRPGWTRVFYAKSANDAGTELDIIMTADHPALVLSTPSGNLPLPDWTVPAPGAYVKYKAWPKDAEVGGNAALASAAWFGCIRPTKFCNRCGGFRRACET